MSEPIHTPGAPYFPLSDSGQPGYEIKGKGPPLTLAESRALSGRCQQCGAWLTVHSSAHPAGICTADPSHASKVAP